MPLYGSQAVNALFPGDIGTLASAETIVSGTASQQFALPRSLYGTSRTISIQVQFSAAPGAFSFTVQHADVDSNLNYVDDGSVSAITTADANNNARVEIICAANFVRLKYGTKPANAVTTSATIG